jgi:hypothetical protein
VRKGRSQCRTFGCTVIHSRIMTRGNAIAAP